MKSLNKYTLFARYIPGLITLLPASLIYFFITKKHAQYELTEYLLSMSFLFGISGTFILTYFIAMVTRELGSLLEERYFHKKSGFPTTYRLLWTDTKFSKQDKKHYAEKIRTDFGLILLNEQQEVSDNAEAIKLLNRASRLLSTKYQQHSQVKEANISYGFARNVSGGVIISLPLSLAGITMGYTQHIPALIVWSSFLALLNTLLIAFHKSWITRNSEKYAEKILSVYFNDK